MGLNLLQTENTSSGGGKFIKPADLPDSGVVLLVGEVKKVVAKKFDNEDYDGEKEELIVLEYLDDGEDESEQRILSLGKNTKSGNASTKQQQFVRLLQAAGWEADGANEDELIQSINQFVTKNTFEVLLKPRLIDKGMFKGSYTLDVLTAEAPQRKKRTKVL